MNVVIVRPANSVTVDGETFRVDCSDLPAYVKAVHWYGDGGFIEFVNDPRGRFMKNVDITDFAPYTYLVDKFNEAKAEAKRIADADALALKEASEAHAALQAPKA